MPPIVPVLHCMLLALHFLSLLFLSLLHYLKMWVYLSFPHLIFVLSCLSLDCLFRMYRLCLLLRLHLHCLCYLLSLRFLSLPFLFHRLVMWLNLLCPHFLFLLLLLSKMCLHFLHRLCLLCFLNYYRWHLLLKLFLLFLRLLYLLLSRSCLFRPLPIRFLFVLLLRFLFRMSFLGLPRFV